MRAMIPIKVAFSDTDAMGVVHHSNYFRYLEIARIQWLADKGVDYKDWVKNNLHLPVIEVQCRYKRPARFGDILDIILSVRKEKLRIVFDYEIRDKATGALVAAAHTEHVCVDQNVKVTRPPDSLLKILDK